MQRILRRRPSGRRRAVVRRRDARRGGFTLVEAMVALALLAIGILVLTVTPNQGAAPLAISATTTPASVRSDPAATVAAARGPLNSAPGAAT